MPAMRIGIGSLNPVKRLAAEQVLRPLYPGAEFAALEVPSGIPAQPWGEEETRQGALNRARAVRAQLATDLAVGFEGGLIRTELGTMTCAWCAVVAADGREGVGGGSHMQLPPGIDQLLDSGIELGEAMDRLTGQHDTKHNLGAIGILTAGLEDRTTAYAHILRLALAPFRSPAFYQGQDRLE